MSSDNDRLKGKVDKESGHFRFTANGATDGLGHFITGTGKTPEDARRAAERYQRFCDKDRAENQTPRDPLWEMYR